jgi:hypothetical protein
MRTRLSHELIRDHIKNAPPRRERFDLNAAINEVIMLAQSAINTSGVSVQTCVTEEVLTVQGDRVQVQQVLLNLLLNAQICACWRNGPLGFEGTCGSTRRQERPELSRPRTSP